MQKGICFFFGFSNNISERAKMIKAVGLDTVMTNADPKFNCQNKTISKQMKAFRDAGLKISSLHMKYNKEDLPHFFMDDKIGDKLERKLIDDVKIAGKYGFKCVVVHLAGQYSEIGMNRIKRVLKVCEKVNVPLALENLNNDEPFCHIMDNFRHPYIKFCYDVGHNNAFHPEKDYLKMYGDRLICVHLHDNDGKKDLHTLNCFGNIDWKKVAKKLAKCPEVSLDYEVMPQHEHELDAEQVLEMVARQANELEKMIKKERIKLKKETK